MKILFFGTRDYDRESFTRVMKDYPEIQIEFTKTNLTWRTAILAKGFTLTLKDGRRVTEAAQIKKGDEITVLFNDGKVKAEIK